MLLQIRPKSKDCVKIKKKADEIDRTHRLEAAEKLREGMLAAEKEVEAKRLTDAAQTPTAQQTPEAIPYGPAAIKMEEPGPPETGVENDTTQQPTLTQEEEEAKHAEWINKSWKTSAAGNHRVP